MADKRNDSEFLKEAMADATALKEVSIANAADSLAEAFTPKLKQLFDDQIREEADGDDEDEDDEDEDDPELDLDDEEEEDEEEDDVNESARAEGLDEEFTEENLKEISDFLEGLDEKELAELQEKIGKAGRHSDVKQVDKASDEEIRHTSGGMNNVSGVSDGYGAATDRDAVMEEVEDVLKGLDEEEIKLEDSELDEAVENFLNELDEEEDLYGDLDEGDTGEVFEINLDEYGSTSVKRGKAPRDQVGVGSTYTSLVDDLDGDGEGVDVYDEFDRGQDYTKKSMDGNDFAGVNEEEDIFDISSILSESDFDDDLERERDRSGELNELSEENAILRDEIEHLEEKQNKYKRALELLQSRISESNLINTKLLYTNKLFNQHGLNSRQKKRVIDAFDRAETVREAKITYQNLGENFTESEEARRGRGKTKEEQLTEGINPGSTSQSQTSTAPDSQILNESSKGFSPERLKKLADVKS